MAQTGRPELTTEELDTIAWDFLRSEFTDRAYAIWPLDRRVDAYLRRCGRDDLINEGAVYEALVQRVMANIGRALRQGLLESEDN